MEEPLLTETKSRHVLFPIQYPDIYRMYKKAASSYWVADEIDFSMDLDDLEKLSSHERHFIFHVLAFFAASDGIVMENLGVRFMNEIAIPEAKAFYAFQNAMEAVHSETYSLLIDTYVKDNEKKQELFEAVNNFPAIREKAEWALRWIADKNAPFAQRLVAFAIVEGLFFSASFCAIFWLRSRGLVPGLSFANQLISRDEGLHTDFACLMYSKIVNRLDEAVVHKMIEEAVDIERRFIIESLECNLIGLNADLMYQYIQMVADRLIAQLGYKKIYHKENPFPFAEISSTMGKSSFFEVRVADYSKATVATNLTFNEGDEDF